MILTAFKFIHVATISIWAAGLFGLPFLYRQRTGLSGKDLFRIHGFTRYLYVNIISPAAFLAIGSGTVLIFLRETYVAWFSAKLMLVIVMTIIHILAGLTILRLFAPGKRYAAWRFFGLTISTGIVVTLILFLVLGKPDFGPMPDLSTVFAPGALQEIVLKLIAWTKS